jgi:hypothetical protein
MWRGLLVFAMPFAVRSYWGYFCDCLEMSSTIIRQVSAMLQHKTATGKGRVRDSFVL